MPKQQPNATMFTPRSQPLVKKKRSSDSFRSGMVISRALSFTVESIAKPIPATMSAIQNSRSKLCT